MRPRLTYANVVATLSLFIAIGGAGAFAASQLGKNSVGPKQLKKNSVTTAKVKKEAITAAKVKRGTLTGAQINISTLGKVPAAEHADSATDAGTLGGLGPDAFVRGTGQILTSRREIPEKTLTPVPVLEIPGLGTLMVNCVIGPGVQFFYRNTSQTVQDYSLVAVNSANEVGTSYGQLAANGGTSAGGGELVPFKLDMQVSAKGGGPTVATFSATGTFTEPLQDGCVAFAEVTWSD